MDCICLIFLYSSLLFYWCNSIWIKWYLDQIPHVLSITEPFEKILEIVTPGAKTSSEDDDKDIIEMNPLPMMIIEENQHDPLLQHFIGSMLTRLPF